MKSGIAATALVSIGLLAASGARAAPPAYIVQDHSTEYLMDEATARAVWGENIPPRLRALYPPRKWGFASEVEGGFNEARTCVVTARAMILPVSTTGRHLMYVPAKVAGAFDSIPNATLDQCKQLSRRKLREAIQAMVFAVSPR
jgi:hypothetical protein